MKKFLGFICILYVGIISYVILLDKLKYFLAPQMQIYIKILIIPLLITGIIFILSKISYEFKTTDIVLLLPLIMILFVGDATLTSNVAKNRMSISKPIAEEKKDSKKEEKEEIKKEDAAVNEEEKDNKIYDFTNPDFEVIDENYKELSSYFAYNQEQGYKHIGKTIKVRGFAIKDLPANDSNHFAIGKYAINCCAADAEFSGFVVYPSTGIEVDHWYEIEGVLKEGTNDIGFTMIYIELKNKKEINKSNEDKYVYPCSSYGNGKCEAFTKYNLQ